MSNRLDLPIYTHLYESKLNALHARQAYSADDGSLVKYMDRIGLLSPRLTVAHGLWSRPDELELLAKRGAHLVVNVLSNFKLKDGIPPVEAFRRAGLGLALGCDCSSCGDVQNLFQAMKLACFVAAASGPDPTTMSASEAVRMATVGGARTAGLEDWIGEIRPGMKADFAILDLDDPAFVPLNSAARQLVYSESGRSVESVIVDGRVVMRDRRITTIDEAAIHREVAARVPSYRKEFETFLASSQGLKESVMEVCRRANTQDIRLSRFFH